MNIKVFSINEDKVIKGKFITAQTNYEFAIKKLYPLINKLSIQRKIQSAKFYARLERDLVKGCIMPPLTLAFVDSSPRLSGKANFEKYLNQNIDDAFVLDGIQRLNTLNRTFANDQGLDLTRPLFLNIILCPSIDNLLYRMITLNNGQKAMTARHQIEILADKVYRFKFDDFPVDLQTEKRANSTQETYVVFKKADIVKAYEAFLGETTNIDNQKIIEEKMDELIAEQILDSNITEDNIEFHDVIKMINNLIAENYLLDWFNLPNNLIGFAAGIRKSYDFLTRLQPAEFLEAITVFEKAFSGFDVSKIKLGQFRRKNVAYFISNFHKLYQQEENELLSTLSVNVE